ncbi:hypothetical protein BDZ89DRAFT_1151193 [Hymenopellis radicata]|nr:hypothetical protein BDZ89DRAFT_1151193 [Hymenopellis radicata]
MSILFRAMSPMASALGHASSANDDDRALARHTALQGAATVEELVAMVPSDYRTVLRAPLLEVAKLTGKLVSARRVHAGFVRHQVAGTYPPALHHKAPAVQFSSEFSSSDAAAVHRKAQEDRREAYLKTLLENEIRAKADEIMFLETGLSPEAAIKQLQPIVVQTTVAIMSRTKVPVFAPEKEGGPPVLSGWADNVAASGKGSWSSG